MEPQEVVVRNLEEVIYRQDMVMNSADDSIPGDAVNAIHNAANYLQARYRQY